MRIKKIIAPKHEATLSPYLREFISTATTVPLPELLDHLATFPPLWPFPRGDLYHWIPLLNRFDEILEETIKKYKLKDGPQTIPWEEFDEKIICGVLKFSRTLVEGCGNRSVYASSAHINELLNTTSLDVLEQCLRLGSRLAQRYYTSRIRGAINTSTNAALLASHYSINLERVFKLSSPFTRPTTTGGTGKIGTRTIAPVTLHDLGLLAREGSMPPEMGSGEIGSKSKKSTQSWDEWGGVCVSYYLGPKPATTNAPTGIAVPMPTSPTTPTPIRRSSTQQSVSLQTPGSAHRRKSVTDDHPEPSSNPTSVGGMQTYELPSSKIKSSSIEDILKTSLPDLPVDTHYDFLQRVRVAKALVTSQETRQKILGIRILALTNLAYVYAETTFTSKILTPDQDEPRRLQLVYQLAELVHTGDSKTSTSKEGRGELPRWLQTLAFGALEGLSKHKSKTLEVCAALSVNVNHGVLLYVLRKMIAELGTGDPEVDDYDQEAEEWRDALFSLASYLPNTSNAGQQMAGAGLIAILCDFLQLRTKKALRYMSKVVVLLDALVYGVNSAFQQLANARGLEIIVDLVADEVKAALQEVNRGGGIPPKYKSSVVDYDITHTRHMTLRSLWKFMHHMMGLSGGNTDRLLRNFIDSPKLLNAVKDVIEAAPVFGTAVWSSTVSILSAFIHNEPTSYAIVHEAGLSQGLLKSVGGIIKEDKEEDSKPKEDVPEPIQEQATTGEGNSAGGSAPETSTMEKGKGKQDGKREPRSELTRRTYPPARGILPASDAISALPTAFGAICLNAAGLTLFQSSGSLQRFFEIFESPDHVKCMADTELASVLGSQFDELVRHHPTLKDEVIEVIAEMCQRVVMLGKEFAIEKGAGAKLWMDDGKGGIIVAGGRRALVGNDNAVASSAGESSEAGMVIDRKFEEEDVEMTDADPLVPTPVAPREQEPDGSPKGEVVALAEVADDDEGDELPKQAPNIATYIDVMARFLEAFLQNSTHSKDFIKRGGLDQLLAIYSLPSLPYDFATRNANASLSRALHILCDNTSQSALGDILEHAQRAVDKLEPLLKHTKKEGYFAPLTDRRSSNAVLPPRLHGGAPRAGDDLITMDDDEEAERQAIENVKANGTKLVKTLVTVHSFAMLLSDVFAQPMFNIRTVMPLFQSISQTTEYETLIPRLGALKRICVWEELLLQKHIPPTWNEATKVKTGLGGAQSIVELDGATAVVSTSPLPPIGADSAALNASGIQEADATGSKPPEDSIKDPKDVEKEVVEREGKTSWFRNVKTIRFLISQIPSSITPFLQGLAKSLFPRRNPDMFHKQHAFKIGEAIADVMIKHLTWERLDTAESITDKYGYWILMLSSISALLLEDRPQAQVITTTLINFKQLGGVKAVTEILDTFWHQVESLPAIKDDESLMSKEDHQKMAHAYGGIKIILSLIANITSYKSVMEATQTTYLQSRERDREKPDYFNPSQLLVELRFAVLPTVKAMWEANFIDKASGSIVKSIIDEIGIILKADGEATAFTKKDTRQQPALLSWRSMEPNEEKLRQLMDMGFTRQEAQASLLRSGGSLSMATEYLLSHGNPTSTRPSQESPTSSRPQTAESSTNSEANTDVDIARDEALARLSGNSTSAPVQPEPESEPSVPPEPTSASITIPAPQPNNPTDSDVAMAMTLDELPLSTPAPPTTQVMVVEPAAESLTEPSSAEKGKGKQDDQTRTAEIITVEDLNDIRGSVRENLINRALDILQVHPDVTFELCALINNAYGKSTESTESKKDIATTIIQSLMSLQLDDDFRPQSKTISATAHLLGLVIQSQEFYDACLDDLKSQIPVLVGFIRIYPGEPAPWVANILLVVEKILAEAAQPRLVPFVPNSEDQPTPPILDMADYSIDIDDKKSLFEAVMAIIPHIERDEVLALSVTRVLAILTRHRELAVRMTENNHLHALFNMLKRHAGLNTNRIQNCIMYILRHIIEDVDTVRAVMKAEIRNWFQQRGSRQIDMSSYIRHTCHLVLRDPEAFVEVTNEICKLTRYDNQTRSLSQQIALKESEEVKSEMDKVEAVLLGVDEAPKDETKDKEPEDKEIAGKTKSATEMKPPGVAKPDGVIHFLLCELLHWRDAEDPEPTPQSKAGDVEMKTPEAAPAPSNAPDAEGTEKVEKSDKPEKPERLEFKAEKHPIYIYRCFILQCLTELLSCYNRSKIEFINFSRKAQPREAITPSKPRSAVLNYLLYDLIPMGSLLQHEEIAYKKRLTVSNWAISAVVSLAAQTGEDSKEDESDLLFVRKFILESILKAYKDAAGNSNEPLDPRYARIMSLADLFYRMLAVRPNHGGGTSSTVLSEKSQQQIARIMFEKNFIGALTSSLAEIDLNFPQSRRVIKYILRPLKVLSKTAIDLSESSEFNPGAIEDDEISIASSLSDVDDMREETPDLYRNSALGMFEGGEMDEDDASDFDEDDDGIIYENEMDYEEEEDEGDSDSQISEEDVPEDAEMDIVLENHDDGTDDEDEDMSEDDMGDDGEEEGVEIIDELADLTGQPGYDNGGEDDDWQSEESDEDDEDQEDEEEEEIMVEEPVESIIRALGAEEGHEEDQLDDRDDVFIDDEAEEEDEEDEEDDELDEEDAMLHAEMDDEGDFASSAPWGWAEDPGDAPMMTRGGQPARGGWYTLGGAPRGELVPNLRQIRPMGTNTRGTEDNTVNPLLQRSNSDQGGHRQPSLRQDLATNWVEDGALATSSAVTMLNTLMNFVARAHAAAPLGHFRLTTTHPAGIVPGFHSEFGTRELRAMFGRRAPAEQPRYHREDPTTVVNNFVPIVTIGRWQEEGRLTHGVLYAEKAQRVVNALLTLLVPPAIEEERLRKETEQRIRAEALALEEERRKKEEEEERIAKEKAEAEEKAKKEAEEREAAERVAAEEAAAAAAAAAAAQAEATAEADTRTDTEAADAMEGVETAQPPTEAGPSEPPQPRATVNIRGREMDITGMEIDPEYLEALPDDLREEVLTNHIRERRAAAAATNDQPSEISREFLDALPDEIREELLAQEANERTRRERDAARARTAVPGAPATVGVDLDFASFLATLDPTLRQTVLLDQDDEALAQLPQAIAAEATALRGDRRLHQFTELPRMPRVRPEEANKPLKKPLRKTAVQMLDKAGVATLLRLMFMPQGSTARSTLHDILLNVCENRQNRSEVLNTLLSILQEGSTDMAAVERTFGQLSLKAKQSPNVLKTPVKRQNTNTSLSLIQSSSEISPLMVAQQCLQALYWLVNYNEHIPSYFLNEHDISTGLKRVNSRKGKGKEIVPPKFSKYPLNTLLGLLDRRLITESTSVMDQLSGLLSEITRPLTVLKKEKKKQEEEKIAQTTVPDAGEPTTTTVTVAQTTSATEEQASGVTVTEKPAEGPSTGENKEEEQPKKQRNLMPPVVPEANLKLVVKVLTARECSAKTFQNTVTSMQNLSGIPGARGVFGQELIEQAKQLGDLIYSHLQGLVEQIHVAESGTEVQGMALSKFSPSSSDQSKLLRVLTALDYLFDPKREKKDKPEETKDAEAKAAEEKPEVEIFAKLYDSKTFSMLWGKLSECLTAIHEREDMLHVATILLPLIEALMVVCKNSGMKEGTSRQRGQTPKPQSPRPDSSMENLFFRFTEDHRKILNQMVRNSPKLMSGSFSLLVNNPKVLEFDNKRNYFNRRLHSRNNTSRDQPPPLQLSVRRDQVFLDSFKSMYFKTADEIKYAKLSIRFSGEEGVDAGGVTREWFQVLARQMFNPDYALFTPVASDRTTFHPNRTSWVNPEHLSFFKFIGRIIGKALYEGRVLDCHFSRAVYKRILGKSVSLKDMETLDLDYYKSLVWMLENDITDIITETFSVEADDYGDRKIIDLVPNGSNLPVTEENKQEYVRLLVEYRLLNSVQEQMDHFLKGFHDIVPADLVAIFNEQELELLISGLPDIDVDDWRNNTEYHNYSASSPQIQWFWRAVRSFDKEERAKLLQFATGTSKVPLNGFKELEGMNGFSKFNIHRDYGSKDRLPSSHTCFNQIDLPEYDSYETLRHSLFTAITQGADHFGFA